MSLPKLRELSQVDDDPLYDSVASDDDYAIVAETPEEEVQLDLSYLEQIITYIVNFQNGEQHDTLHSNAVKKDSNDNTVCAADLELMTKKLEVSDTTISSLKQEVNTLRAMVEKLNSENSHLKSRLSHAESGSVQSFAEGDSGCSSLDRLLTVNFTKITFM